MKRIASFEVDHTKLNPGVYVSRRDGDITTYDLRFCKPNCGEYLAYPAIHTVEHIFATYARNSKYAEKIIYFGPMGCRTGFYFLVRDMTDAAALELIKEAIDFTARFEGDIPGVSAAECGNYLEHSLEGAKEAALGYLDVIQGLTADDLFY